MADITVMSSVLSSIEAASDIVRVVRESGATLQLAEYKLKLAELVEKLANAKMQLGSVQDVIDEKEKRIRQLEQEAATKGKLKYEPPHYWLEANGCRDGPYCQQCYDSGKKLIRLTNSSSRGSWACRTCKSGYQDSSCYPDDNIWFRTSGLR